MDRATFMAAATRLHELEVESGALGLGHVWIRELTARQRVDALEGAYLRDTAGQILTTDQGYNRYDDALYRAFILQASLISGAGGDLVLTIEDVSDLASKGRECLRGVTDQVLSLSWLTKEQLFRGDPQADDRQQDPSAGAGAPGDGAERERASGAGVGSDVADGSGGDEGAAAG
jgi:hypothetical protein